MRDLKSKIVIMQWAVIAVLVAGAGAAVIMLMSRADTYKSQLDQQTGDLSSLREQLRQAKSPQPSPSPALPAASANTASPTPSPAASASPTPSPRPGSNR